MDIVDFSHENIYQGKVVFETTTFNFVCPSIPAYTQICPDLKRVLVDSRGVVARLNIIQNVKF